MSNEIVDQTTLIAALKETQQAVSQLQNPLETLALTQLIELTYISKKDVIDNLNKWKAILPKINSLSATLESIKDKGLIEDQGIDSLKKLQEELKQTKDGLKQALEEKEIIETTHPLIVKLAKHIDGIA